MWMLFLFLLVPALVAYRMGNNAASNTSPYLAVFSVTGFGAMLVAETSFEEACLFGLLIAVTYWAQCMLINFCDWFTER
jgi:ABC-type spermidine/putrescine transport system permease subunit II